MVTVAMIFFIYIKASSEAEASVRSTDIISIRAIPNFNHYSPIRWYAQQGYSGSPQFLQVDGYEAIRDGNTVYVNAANISSNILYTNIYALAFNIEAEQSTGRIFNSILQTIKFNRNIFDSDQKNKIVQDTRRLSDIAEISILLEKYHGVRGYYPILSAGTYMPNVSISTWPSWQETLAKELGVESLPVDPVNELVCNQDVPADIELSTCWSQSEKKFYDSGPDSVSIELATGSAAYVYSTNPDGSDFSLIKQLQF